MNQLQPGRTLTPNSDPTQRATRPPLAGFLLAMLAGAAGVAVGEAALFGFEQRGLLALTVGMVLYLVAAGTAGVFMVRFYPHAALGLCNIVTLVRLVIVAALAGALISSPGPSWPIFLIAAGALSLDGLDGWLARRQGLASSFGARFDMEVDAAFSVVLALHAVVGGSAGVPVMVLALPHYLFSAAVLLFPWLGQQLPDRFSRKIVCVVQLAVLIALQLPAVTPGALDPLIVAVACALAWSFGRDIVWLWRTRS